MDAFLHAFPVVFTPSVLGAVGLGTVIGLVFGAIPGLTYTMALSLVLPLTFGAATMPAVALMVGTYVGGMTGGSVSAILIGVPGTPSAAATVLDGYPMRQAGKASLALGLAVISSTFGGLISLFIMVVSVQLVSRLAIKFGPAEIFALVVFGMSTICGLAEKSLVRGLIAGVLGLMMMTIGLDEITGDQRLTFGTVTFQQGVNLVVAMIGLFAVPHIIQTFAIYRAGLQKQADPQDARLELPSLALMRRTFGVMMRSSLIGTVIGAIPGASGPIGAFIAYDQARRFSKDKARFGKGVEEGVIAPETANNAVSGGTFIPLLSLGIPGDPATAVILSGLLIHGLFPGPMLFREHPIEIYGIYLTIIIAYIVILVVQLFGIRLFVKILLVPPHLLVRRRHGDVRDRLLRHPQLGVRRLYAGRLRAHGLSAAARAHPGDAVGARAGAGADAGKPVPHRHHHVRGPFRHLLHVADRAVVLRAGAGGDRVSALGQYARQGANAEASEQKA